MRDRHNAQKNKEPVEIRKKNKPEQNISYTEFMK
jgi:hypothetical protein